MDYIVVDSVKKFPSYVEIVSTMRFDFPAVFIKSGKPIVALKTILDSFQEGYGLEYNKETPPVAVCIIKSERQSVKTDVKDILIAIENELIARHTELKNKLDNIELTAFDTIAGLTWDGTTWSEQVIK